MANSSTDTNEMASPTSSARDFSNPWAMYDTIEEVPMQDMNFSACAAIPKLPRICTSSKGLSLSPVSVLQPAPSDFAQSPAASPVVARQLSGFRNGPGLPVHSSRASLTLPPASPLSALFALSHQPCSEIPSPWSGGAAYRRCSGDYTARFRRLSSFDFAAQLQAEDDAAFDDANARSWVTPLSAGGNLQRVL